LCFRPFKKKHGFAQNGGQYFFLPQQGHSGCIKVWPLHGLFVAQSFS
jgi:hypothetical protein